MTDGEQMSTQSRNTDVAKRIAELLHRAAIESNYPPEWNQWKPPLSFYVFQATEGNVKADQVGSFGAGWWMVNDNQLVEIETPPELLPTHADPGLLLLPELNFLIQRDQMLITETYCQSLCLRRRCSVTQLQSSRRIDELPELWRHQRTK